LKVVSVKSSTGGGSGFFGFFFLGFLVGDGFAVSVSGLPGIIVGSSGAGLTLGDGAGVVRVERGFDTVSESWWTTYPTPTATSVTKTAAVTRASVPGVHFTAARYLAPRPHLRGMPELRPGPAGSPWRGQNVVPGTIGAGGVAVSALGKVAVSMVASPMIIGWSVVLATSALRSSM